MTGERALRAAICMLLENHKFRGLATDRLNPGAYDKPLAVVAIVARIVAVIVAVAAVAIVATIVVLLPKCVAGRDGGSRGGRDLQLQKQVATFFRLHGSKKSQGKDGEQREFAHGGNLQEIIFIEINEQSILVANATHQLILPLLYLI